MRSEVKVEIEKISREIKEKSEVHERLLRELDEVRVREVLVRAELTGLQGRLDALTAAARDAPQDIGSARSRPASESDIDWTRRTLVDAVVHVIDSSDEPLHVSEIRSALRRLGRSDEAPTVAATLNYAKRKKDILYVARGVYGRRPS